MPRVLNKRTDTIPTDAVYIGRPSLYGNPFPITNLITREMAVDAYRKYINKNPNLIKQVKENLKGKDLVCFCAPLACHGDILLEIANPRIFVFGSNLAGRHGKGAALYARKYKGAIYGKGTGRQGDSFAIPTKDHNLNVIPLKQIQGFIENFILYAVAHPELEFQVTRIGCGLAGYKPSQIAPLFVDAPDNCYFDWNGETYGEPKN